jgi:hypothetical protein
MSRHKFQRIVVSAKNDVRFIFAFATTHNSHSALRYAGTVFQTAGFCSVIIEGSNIWLKKTV